MHWHFGFVEEQMVENRVLIYVCFDNAKVEVKLEIEELIK